MSENMQLVANIKIDLVDTSNVDTALKNTTKTLTTQITEAIMRGTAAAGQASKNIPSSKTLIDYSTRDLKRDLLGASGIGGELDKIKGSFGNVAQSGSKAAGKLSGGGDAAGIITILATLFGDSFTELINILQSIVKILLAMTGILMVLRIISDVISAVWNAFGNLEKIWGAVMMLISKMVSPFVNLLIPLLVPFLYLFGTIGRVLNLMLMPLFTIMMKAFSALGKSGTMQTATTQIMGGDLVGGIMTIISGLGDVFNSLKDQIMTVLQPLFDMLAGWIMSFLTLDIEGIKKTLNGILGKDLGGMIGWLIEIFWKVGSALMGFVSQLMGANSFNQMLGSDAVKKLSLARETEMAPLLKSREETVALPDNTLGKKETLAAIDKQLADISASYDKQLSAMSGSFENIQTTNSAFKTGAGIGAAVQEFLGIFGKIIETLKGLWAQLSDWLVALVNDPIGTLWSTLCDTITIVTDGLKTLLFGSGEQMSPQGFEYTQKPKTEPTPYNLMGGSNPFDNITATLKPVSMEEVMKKQGLLGAINTLIDQFTGINVKEFWDNLMVSWNTNVKPAIDKAVTAINEFLAKEWVDFKNALQTLIDAVGILSGKFIFDPAAVLYRAFVDNISAYFKYKATLEVAQSSGFDMSKLQNWLLSQFQSLLSGDLMHNDFIVRPGGQVSQFSPDDTIIGVKDTSKLGGMGGSTNVTNNYYITGNGDRFLENTMVQIIEKTNANASRSGFYQQGR